MTPEEVYQIWAPAESIWSPWAIPVPFTQMICVETVPGPDLTEVEGIASLFNTSAELALVVDLPGVEAIKLGLSLAKRGFRPVPVIDGSPGPGIVGLGGAWMDSEPRLAGSSATAVDMRFVLRALCQGAALLREMRLAPEASPVFLLDAMRLAEGRMVTESMFDNRWKTFPQDYPSARFLQERGVHRVVLVQERAGQPREDLSHVLLRWQEAGIGLEICGTQDGGSLRPLLVNRPSHFRVLWQRVLAIFGLRRSVFGGFGNWPYGTSGG